jgi:hypothetical protein
MRLSSFCIRGKLAKAYRRLNGCAAGSAASGGTMLKPPFSFDAILAPLGADDCGSKG